jgi:hypothetical protein
VDRLPFWKPARQGLPTLVRAGMDAAPFEAVLLQQPLDLEVCLARTSDDQRHGAELV